MKVFANNLISSKSIAVISWIIFAIPFVIYGLCVFRYAADIPFQDDYDAALNFTNTYIQTQTSTEKIALLFSQHNEHRIVFVRLVFLCSYYLFREVNFKFCIVFGNLGWILTLVMLVLYFQKKFHLSLAHLLPLPYLLLTFTHWENMFFAMAAIQNYWFMFFSIAFLICLAKDRPLSFCALFPIALFTSGAGVVLYPLGNLFLILQKKRRSLAWFFVLSTSCMLLYFYNYHKPAIHPSILDAVATPFRTMAYFFSFWGNIVPLHYMSILAGLILCSLSIYLVIRGYGDSFFQLAIGFIALIALTSALTRSGLGVWQSLSSRYSLFPLFGLVCIYLCIVISIPRAVAAHRVVLVSAILCAISFWGIATVYYEQTRFFQKIKDERIAGIAAFSNGDKSRLLYPDKDRAAHILLKAKQMHIYHYQDQTP
jgi:hypothetical protein